MELKYEDLVGAPRQTMERVLEFLGEPWDEDVLCHHEVVSGSRDSARFPANIEATQPVQRSAVGRWRDEMSDEDKRIFKDLAGPLLVELGYETGDDW